MAKSYLDKPGLTYLWGKIKDRLGMIDSRIKEIESDGGNLMINTLNPDSSDLNKLPRIFGQPMATRFNTNQTVTTAEHGIRSTSNGAQYTFIAFGEAYNSDKASLCGLIPGQTYTLSFDATWKQLSAYANNSATTSYYMRAVVRDNTYGDTSQAIVTSNFGTITKADRGTVQTGRGEVTFTVPADATLIYIVIFCSRTTNSSFSAGDFIELRNIKLEKGSVATPWEPYYNHSIHSGGGVSLSDVYPVGSIYLSTVATNPATLFGFGTWEQIKDKFLLSAGDTYSAGDTGGAASHSHTLGGAYAKMNVSSSSEYIDQETVPAWQSNITKALSGTMTSASVGHTNGLKLGGSTDSTSNLPPYLTVYMWKRTA